VIAILASVLMMYNAQLVASFPSKLQSGARSDAAATEAVQAAAAEAGAPGVPAEAAGKGSPEEPGFIDTYLIPETNEATAIVFAISGLLLIGFSFLNRYSFVWSNNLMLQRMQHQLHDKLLLLGPNYHARHDLGENSALIMQFTQGAQQMLREIIAFPFVRTISLGVALTLLYYNLGKLETEGGDKSLTYVILFVLIIILPLGGWWLSKSLRVAFGETQRNMGALSNALVDSLSSPQEVQIMNAVPRRSAAIGARLAALLKAQLRANFRSELANQFQTAVPTVLQIGLILYAVFGFTDTDPVSRAQQVGAIIGIYFFVPMVVNPIQELIKFYTGLNTSWPQIERVGLTIDEPLEVQDRGRKTVADLKGHDVALNNVRFAPQPDRVLLDGLSFAFPQGKVTTIVGRSGSGKTTILRLISRLFDPQEGSVTIGGVDIRELELSELRSLIGTVSQFPLFIEADVRENLRLAAPEATDAEMEAACRAADLWEALERVSPSDPLAAPVPRTAGKSGLSGGERRRLAIARALLTNPRILLLDEPSPGIDPMSVKKIIESIRQAKVGRTVLLIDHELDFIEAVSDQICCHENGRFTDIGTPAELASRPTLYAKLLEARKAYSADFEIHGSVPARSVDMPPPPPGMTGATAMAMKGPPPGAGPMKGPPPPGTGNMPEAGQMKQRPA
jgi:ABC-type multidrug transport system fused ATPase/permease subunit